ncbi:MAG: complex I subunit 5 family protein [Candidatus Dormibacteraceae bacterium]
MSTPVPALAPMVPLIVAAALGGTNSLTRRRVIDPVATATAAAVLAMCVFLLIQSSHHTIVYWFGGWTPRRGIALGVSFVIDPIGAGAAVLGSGLVLAALVFSWRYFDAVGSLYHSLMLVFLAAMVGFSLTGDIFDLFVFFELMSVAAFVLTGYKVEEQGPIQGALNFAVTGTLAALLVLTGIALVYGRTGALNLAQIGRSLAGHPADGLIVVAFVFLMAGFFIKAAVVPFHLWLPDAETVAPIPVCVLLSGVMVELGLYAVWRIYWTAFSGPLAAHGGIVREVLVIAGVATGLVGAVMCFYQHHLKRLLAFSTISHVGVFLIGAALLTPLGLAGSAVYVLGHAGVKASLFLCVGIITHRLRSVDEIRLRGRGRRMVATGVLYALGGLGLSGMPPFGTFLGGSMIEGAAGGLGYPWVQGIVMVIAILVGAAVLRTAAYVFLGWGVPEHDAFYSPRLGDELEPETIEHRSATPSLMVLPAAALLAGGLVTGLVPQLAGHAQQAAALFQDRALYAATVLGGDAAPPRMAIRLALPTGSDYAHGLGSTAGAVLLAAATLYRRRLPSLVRHALARIVGPPVIALRSLQSGNVTDYVTWIMVGVAAFGAVFALAIR